MWRTGRGDGGLRPTCGGTSGPAAGHVFGEHAEDQPVDEVRHDLRVVPALPQSLRQFREGGRRLLGQRLPRLFRSQPLRAR